MTLAPNSRRSFLKGCLAGGAAAAVTVAPETACARDTLPRPPEKGVPPTTTAAIAGSR